MINKTIVHNKVFFRFVDRVGVCNCSFEGSIEQAYERAVHLGYVPVKWYQFWRKNECLEVRWIHGSESGVVFIR